MHTPLQYKVQVIRTVLIHQIVSQGTEMSGASPSTTLLLQLQV